MRESLGAAIGACTGAASDLWSRVVSNTTPLVSLSAVERFAMTTIANEAVFATVQQDAKHTATQIADRIADH
jgi:hypothetical protein